MNIIFQEALLEPIARLFRFKKGITEIRKRNNVTIVDLGSGPLLPFYKYILDHEIRIKKYIGIDPLISSSSINSYRKNKNVHLIRNPLEKKIPLPSSIADYVVSFATLEHFDHPKDILNDALRILKKNGKVILTTPTFRSKPLLEFLERIRLLSSREIHEHKNYFDRNSLRKIVDAKNIKFKHSYFEFGLNNLLVISRD